MPSRKQRRRRQKERRHEYEYVYVDEEGHELDPSEVDEGEEEKPTKPARSAAVATTAKPKTTPAKKGSAKSKATANIRPVPPPSWRRVAKRGLIFAPFMLLAITLLGRGLSWPARILETAWLLVLFVPFSYLIDRMMYRRYLRQIGQEPPTRQRRA
jgi:ferric-dicitrate binding protein FerR (iron transport regulator)